jgi:hypothetical protein
MCTSYYTTKIYSCGHREEEDMKVESCSDKSKAGHQVIRKPLASRREAKKCGKYSCENP